MCRWLFLQQNDRVVNISITHDYLVPSLSFNVSRSSGNSNSNMASWRQVSALVYARSVVPLHTVWNSFKTWYCEYVLLSNFIIITRNYCLNKTTLIFCHVSFVSQHITYSLFHKKYKENIYIIIYESRGRLNIIIWRSLYFYFPDISFWSLNFYYYFLLLT